MKYTYVPTGKIAHTHEINMNLLIKIKYSQVVVMHAFPELRRQRQSVLRSEFQDIQSYRETISQKKTKNE